MVFVGRRRMAIEVSPSPLLDPGWIGCAAALSAFPFGRNTVFKLGMPVRGNCVCTRNSAASSHGREIDVRAAKFAKSFSFVACLI